MTTTRQNAHFQSPAFGHTTVQHDGHEDYLHNGHLLHANGALVEEHRVAVNGTNPARCTPDHNCGSHDLDHKHGPSCGHEAVPHGDHVDYLVNSHLHHPHGDHCDHHGEMRVASAPH